MNGGELIHESKSGETKIVASHWYRYQSSPDGYSYIIELNNDISGTRTLEQLNVLVAEVNPNRPGVLAGVAK